MPENSPEPLDRAADRPHDVTDPLLWKLALEVADAHGPDDDGGCRNLGCTGQSWPCTAWNTAQHALQVARTDTGPVSRPSPDAAPQPDRRHPVVGWSTNLVPSAVPLLGAPANGASKVVVSAA